LIQINIQHSEFRERDPESDPEIDPDIDSAFSIQGRIQQKTAASFSEIEVLQ
jgi:hypothetical protein